MIFKSMADFRALSIANVFYVIEPPGESAAVDVSRETTRRDRASKRLAYRYSASAPSGGSGQAVRGAAEGSPSYAPIRASAYQRRTPPQKNPPNASAVSFGSSSGKKWPAFSARPRTSPPRVCQSAKERAGDSMTPPGVGESCGRPRVAVARYSSQMALA